jgi:malonyl-CoA O-methyltransferase
MSVLAPREAYRLWAPTYEAENAITHLEQRLVRELGPSPAGLCLLDVGCGTGRRLVGTRATRAVGVDLSPEMIAAGRETHAFGSEVRLQVGDVRELRLPDAAFDLVWCRLVVGHLDECRRAYRELARVTRKGGAVIVTDFHPAAHAAGHRRTFRHGDAVHEAEHHVHPADEQVAAATAAGLMPAGQSEAGIGPEVRPFYETAGKQALYERDLGLPVVLALAFRRGG